MSVDPADPYADLKQHRSSEIKIPAGYTRPKKRNQHFIMVPWRWVEALQGATGQTYHVALCLLYMRWRGGSETVKLSNKAIADDGISRQSKWRALRDLERRGLITLECRPGRSPVIRVKLSHL
jgi:hypothetical protein